MKKARVHSVIMCTRNYIKEELNLCVASGPIFVIRRGHGAKRGVRKCEGVICLRRFYVFQFL